MGEVEIHVPLLAPIVPEKRTGDVWSASAHIITLVTGSGVLVTAWSIAQLGWIVGPISILTFSGISTISAFLLCDCYKSPDPEHGPIRNGTYMDAVKLNLGRNSVRACGLFQQLNLYLAGIAFILSASISMRAIPRSNCFHKEGHEATCVYGEKFYMLLFGAIQICASQIRDYHDMAWLSILAAVMSFSYSFTGLGLGFAEVLENGYIKGSIEGTPQATGIEKVWKVAQALGDIAFAISFSVIVFEIQDTLKSKPAENRTMKKASIISVSVVTFFYLCCGCFGYAAFGDKTPGNFLAGIGFYEPYWLVDFANTCVVIYMVGAYQIVSQPVFAFCEGWLANKFPGNTFVIHLYKIKLPLFPAFNFNLLQLSLRTALVISETGIAIVFPYFNEVLGVIGSVTFWPMTCYFPVQLYIAHNKITAWTRNWVLLQTFNYVCLILMTYCFVGSVQGLIVAKSS